MSTTTATSAQVTAATQAAPAPSASPAAQPTQSEGCKAPREVLGLVADKWSLLVVSTLGDGSRRFTELKRLIDGISQRMLTVTLRSLERDGLLTRTVYEVMPPHVSYRLTPMGADLLQAAAPLIEWSTRSRPRVEAARAEYDARPAPWTG
jgi:DNA-binding HxlR family transcriptional regulator